MADLKEAPKPKTPNGPGPMKDLAPRASAVPTKANGIPLAFVRRFAGEIDRLFEDFGFETGLHMPRFLSRGHELLRREAGLIPAEWSPRVDVLESEGRIVVRADLPGLTKEDIKVEVTDDMIVIQGERKQEKKEQGEGYKYSECSYGTFYRAIPLPEGCETSKATADFQKGVLEVAVPVPPHAEPKARRLEIREKS